MKGQNRDVFLKQAVNGLFSVHGDLAALSECLIKGEAEEGDERLAREIQAAIRYLRRLRDKLCDARHPSPLIPKE